MKKNEIIEMLEKFNHERISKTIHGDKCHDALIGEWIRWWTEDSNVLNKERSIHNPAIQAELDGKRRTSDLLFMERSSSGLLDVLGVAEIENNPKKYLGKVESLRQYELATTHDKLKFPNLQFAILSTHSKLIGGLWKKENTDLFNEVFNKMYEISSDSNLYWITFQLKQLKVEKGETIRVPKYEGFEAFYYYYQFAGSPNYIIFKNGEIIKQKMVDIEIEEGRLIEKIIK